MIILHGGTLHKFYKPIGTNTSDLDQITIISLSDHLKIGSVSIATNLVSPFDAINIMKLIDEWIIASWELRKKLLLFQRLSAHHIAQCARENWYTSFNDTLYLGDHALRAVLPLVYRAYAEGIQPHPLLKQALYKRHDQAKALDEADEEGDLNNGGSWLEALTHIVGPLSSKAEPKNHVITMTRDAAERYWCTQPHYWEEQWRHNIIDKDREIRTAKLKKEVEKKKVDWSDEYVAVPESTAIWDGVSAMVDPLSAAVKKEKKEIEAKLEEKEDDELPDYGLHETVKLKVPKNTTWPDTDIRFMLLGGYIRYVKGVHKDGGQHAYTAKYCHPLPTVESMSILPKFNLAFHRETWNTSSANLFVGWHDKTLEQLAANRKKRGTITTHVEKL